MVDSPEILCYPVTEKSMARGAMADSTKTDVAFTTKNLQNGVSGNDTASNYTDTITWQQDTGSNNQGAIFGSYDIIEYSLTFKY